MINSIKGKLTLGLAFTIVMFILLIAYTSITHRNIIRDYETLTDNISYSENLAYLSESINQNVIYLYSDYDIEVQMELKEKMIYLEETYELMTRNMFSKSSLILLERLERTLAKLNSSALYFVEREKYSSIVKMADNRDLATRSNSALQEIIRDLTKSELVSLQLMRVNLKATETKMLMQLIIFILIVLSVIIVTLSRLNRSIYRNAEKLRTLFKAIGEGDLNSSVPEIESNDELKDILVDIIAMRDSLKSLTHDKEMSKSAIITAIGSLAEMRDSDTYEHIHNMQGYLRIMCDHMMKSSKYQNVLSEWYIDTLIQVSPLHDIGKVGIPDSVLLKPGKLTKDEFEIMKTHVKKGQHVIHQAYEIYDNGENNYLEIAEQVIRDHHERWDGNGYPRRVSGEDISFAGRIVAIVDVYDALTTNRVYKDAYDHDIAVEIIRSERGKQFDPDLVDIFLTAESSFSDVSEKVVVLELGRSFI